jgi:hypothetical protein
MDPYANDALPTIPKPDAEKLDAWIIDAGVEGCRSHRARRARVRAMAGGPTTRRPGAAQR